jgi:hypothetical protein
MNVLQEKSSGTAAGGKLLTAKKAYLFKTCQDSEENEN